MAEGGAWAVVFSRENNGGYPVREFLQSLDSRTQMRFAWSMEQLRVRNVMALEPLVRHLEGKLWELREESNTDIYRIIYFFFSGRRIVFLHGFQKKTEKTPRREIEVALRRLDSFMRREAEKR